MKRSEYLQRALDAYELGRVDSDTYDSMVENADIFCEEDEDECGGIPRAYAEIEYNDFDNPEAVQGARWDDMNYLHYMER